MNVFCYSKQTSKIFKFMFVVGMLRQNIILQYYTILKTIALSTTQAIKCNNVIQKLQIIKHNCNIIIIYHIYQTLSHHANMTNIKKYETQLHHPYIPKSSNMIVLS